MERDPREMGDAPADLEDRVVAELRRSGLLKANDPVRFPAARIRPIWNRWALPVAALFLGAILSWALLGTRSAPPPATSEQALFLLVFSGGPQEGDELVQCIRANGEWARTTLADHYVGGQRLRPEGTVLVAGLPAKPATMPRRDDFTPTGFFLIRARDLAEAVALGSTSPHLDLGGHLTVRPIDDFSWLPPISRSNG